MQDNHRHIAAMDIHRHHSAHVLHRLHRAQLQGEKYRLGRAVRRDRCVQNGRGPSRGQHAGPFQT